MSQRNPSSRSKKPVLSLEALESRDVPAAFTAGNLVIYRVGDGSAALSNAATAVFLDEYTPSGALVQSIAVPTAVSGSNFRLTASGTATSEGSLMRSTDGRFLTLTGYDAALATAAVASTTSAAAARVIGRVDANGAIDTTTTTSFSGNNIRSATSTNGTDIWAVGGATGVVYTTLGSTSAGTVVSNTITTIRTVNVFAGQLYVSANSGTTRLAAVGTGTPTASGSATTNLPGTPTATSSPYQFVLLDRSASTPGIDTLYYVDDTISNAGGIYKYSFDGSTWTARGLVFTSVSPFLAARGLTALRNADDSVTLYATTADGRLISFTDTAAFNATISAGTPTVLATQATNTAFRGLAWAPEASAAPTVTSIARQSPAGQTTSASSVTFRVTFSKAVFGVDANDFALGTISGSTATGTIGSVTAVTGSNSTQYDVTVSGITGAGDLRLDLIDNDTITEARLAPLGGFGAQSFTTGDVFTIVATPTITGFTPASGPVGTSVTITGTNFTGATAVKFNGTDATTFTVNSATQITATVPTGATSGTVSVTTPGGTAASSASYTVTVAGTPSVTDATTNEDTQTTSGLVITQNGTSGDATAFYKITGITNGALFKSNGTTQINNGDFITLTEGAAGLKFTPNANFFGTGSFQVQASTSNADAGLGGSAVTASITVNAVADTPSVTNATTNEDTQTTSGLVVSRNAADGAEVTHFKITGVTNGTLFLNDGTTAVASGDFVTFAQANAGLKFTPNANFFGTGSFQVQASLSASDAGLGGSVVTAAIAVSPVADTPSVTNATTTTNAQTTSGLVVSRNAADGSEVTHFKVTNITNGALFLNDGTTAVANGTFLTFAQANAGLKFTPTVGFAGTGSFQVQASLSNSDAGLGGSVVTATITVTPVLTPSVSGATTDEDTQTASGLVVTANANDAGTTAFYKVTGITGGALFKSNGTTSISNGDFITLAEGAAGLKFTPGADLNSPGSTFGFSVQASTSASDAGLGGSAVAASITVNAVNDAPVFAALTNVTVNQGSGAFTQTDFVAGIGPGGGADEAGQTVTFGVTNDNSALFATQPALTGTGATRTLTFTPSASAGGTATVTVTATDSGSGTAPNVNTFSRTFTVTVNAVTPPTNDTVTYGGNAQFTANISGLQTVKWQVLDGGTWTDLANGGVYSGVTSGTLSLTQPGVALSGTQYRAVLTNPSGTVTTSAATLTVTPKALTATATAANKVYDGNTAALVSITLGGVVSGDTVIASATGTFDNKNVGTGKTVTVGSVTLSGADAANYTVGAAANTTADVTPKALTATATAANKVYDGNTAASVSINLSGVESGDTVAGAATGTFDNKNVGTGKTVTVGTVTLAGPDAGNYTVGTAANTTADITVRAITVTANANQGKTVGAADPVLTFTVTSGSLATGDAFTGSLTRAAGETVGGYAIMVGSLTAGTNYDQTFVGATFTISAAPNAAPVVTTSAGTTAAVEQTAIAIDANITVTDDGANLTGATVAITGGFVGGQDVLSFTDQNGITGGYANGVLTLTGTSSVANYQTALRSITYTNTSDAPDTANRTVTFTATDGAASSAAVTKTVSVAAVNDAPVNGVPGTQTVAEDATLTFSAANINRISIADSDVDAGEVLVALTATNGTFTLTSDSGLIFVSGANGTAAFTFRAQLDVVNARLAEVVFTPTPDFNGEARLRIVTNDQGNTGTGGELTDDDTIIINVTEVNDAPTAVNDTLSAVAEDSGPRAISLTDLLANDSRGPANESAQTLTAISVGSAVGGSVSISGTNVLFTPAADFFGTARFNYTIRDDGTTNGVADPKTATGTVSFTVNPVADTPSVTNATTNEGTQTTSGLVVSRNAADGAEVTHFKVTNITNGTLFLNDGTTQVTNGSFITFAQASAGLKFTPTAGFAGTGSFQAQASLSNSDAGLGGSAATATITVNALILTPSVTDATTNEDAQTTSGLVVTANAADGGVTAFYKVTGITNGALFKSDGTTPINNGDFITKAEGAAGLKFTPGANFFGTGSFQVQASTSNADAGLRGSGATASITVNPIADTPSVTNATTTTNAQTTSGLVISRNAADGAEVTHFQITNITNGTLFLSNGTTQVNNGDFITAAQGAVGLKFTPTTGFAGTGSFGVRASLSASAAGLGGGVATANISVSAVLTPSVTSATTNEDTQTASGLVVTANPADGGTTAFYKVTGITGGTLFLSNGTTLVGSGSFITAAQGAAGLKFTPAANQFGSTGFGFTVQASTTNSDIGLGGSPVAAVVVVNPVADMPSITNATTNEDTQTTSGLVVTRNAADGSEVTHVRVTGITNGTLFLNDGTTPISNGSFVTFAQANAGLKFTPNANFFGTGSFQAQASLGASVAGLGGSVVTASITVNPVADTPSVTGATTDEDTQTTSGLVISRNAADGSEVTHFKVTGVTNGTLFLNDGTTPISNGAFVTAAQGSAGLKFTPATDLNSPSQTNFSTNSTFGFSVQASTSASDAGLGGAVVPVAVLVDVVNDAPEFTLSGNPPVVNEDSGAQTVANFATGIRPGPITATDEIEQEIEFRITTNNDALFAAGPEIDFAGALTYTPAAGMSGTATVTVRLVDAFLLFSAPQTFTITVNPVNDAPLLTLAGDITVTTSPDTAGLNLGGTYIQPNFAALAPGGGTDEQSQTVAGYNVTVDRPEMFVALPTINGDGTLSFTLVNGAVGVVTVTATGRDSGGTANGGTDTSAAKTFAITVNPITDEPVPGTRVGAAASAASSAQFIAVGTDAGAAGTVRVLAAGTRAPVRDIVPFPGYSGGVKVALGDVNGDGRDDLIVGTAALGSHVKVFDLATGAELRSFLAFPGFTGGVDVAAGDVNGDGRADIVVGAATGISHVKVFDGATGAEVRSFLAFPGFTGGVKVAVGDVTGDGRADIAVLAGPGGNGHVKVFGGATGALLTSFLGYVNYLGAIDLAVGDVDGDGRAEVVTAALSPAGGTHVKAFNRAGDTVRSFFAPVVVGSDLIAGAPPQTPVPGTVPQVAVADLDGDRVADYLLGSQSGAGASKLLLVSGATGAVVGDLFAFDPLFGTRVFVG